MTTNLERFRFYMQDVESPDHFIDWNFYFAISSCLGRRIWFKDDWSIHPNMFVTFVAEPGVGKSVPAVETKKLLASMAKTRKNKNGDIEIIPAINMSPDSVTLQALWDTIADSIEYIQICDNPKKMYVHSSVCFSLPEELGTLFNEEAKDLVPFLNQAWSCGDFHRKTRTQGEVFLKNMCVNLLGCCQPNWVRRNIRDEILEEGYGARSIWIYGSKPRHRSTVLRTTPEQRTEVDIVKKHWRELCLLPPSALKFGPIDTPEVWEWLDHWVKNKQDIKLNQNSKLGSYYGRKKLHLIKMAMAVHFSDFMTLTLTVEDFTKALDILERNEVTMHLALSGSGNNPLNALAESIMKSIIKLNGDATHSMIVLENYDSGDIEQIDKSIDFLKETGQIRTSTRQKDGKTVYHPNRNNEQQSYTI